MSFFKSAWSMSVIALALMSCNSNSGSSANTANGLTIEPLTNDSTAAKQILFFRLVDEVSTDSSVVYTGRSTFGVDTVGLRIEVLRGIAPGILPDGKIDEIKGFRDGAIKLSSVGAESDQLVKALGSMFKVTTTGKMVTTPIAPLVFSSNNEEVDLSKKSTYRFKLAFDNKDGSRAEVFAVLDTYRRGFEISERDSVYRPFLISAFEGK